VTSLLVQHRLAVAIVGVAVLATTGVFVFARPEYRPPGSQNGKALVFSDAKPPAHGWDWADGTPGFHFGDHNDEWNISQVRPRELASVRAAARRAGVSVSSLGVLQAMRTQMHVRPSVLVAGADAAGRTCIGAQLHHGAASFVCPPSLDGVVGVVVAEASPASGAGHGMFLTGVARADVTRVTVSTPGSTYTDMRSGKPVIRPFGPQTAYVRAHSSWWGTLLMTTSQPGLWDAQIVFYGVHGSIASVDVRFAHAGARLVYVR